MHTMLESRNLLGSNVVSRVTDKSLNEGPVRGLPFVNDTDSLVRLVGDHNLPDFHSCFEFPFERFG